MEIAVAKPYRGMRMEGWVANWYAGLTKKDLPQYQDLARTIAVELPAGSRILEVAPGPGFLSIELARLGAFAVAGIDISRSFVAMARENAQRQGVRVDFRHGDAAALPFANDTFDRVVCRAAFKNFSRPAMAVQEMHRVLKPGGKALIIDLRKDASPTAIDAYIEELHAGLFSSLVTKWTFRLMLLKRAYSRSQFADFIAQSGFLKSDITEAEIGFRIWLEK